MKRLICTVLLTAIVLMLFPISSDAAGYVSGFYTYTVTDGKATITAVNKSTASGSITVPNLLGGYPVTAIGYRAFYNCTYITSIIIPQGVSSIGDNAFANCSGLVEINLPGSVSSIGIQAFNYCSNITNITIPQGVATISDNAFANCTALLEISLPASLLSIGDFVFLKCTSLSTINVDSLNPNFQSINGILFSKDGTKLFYYPASKAETSFDIPNTVTTIGVSAFNYNYKLTSVTIPSSVTTIGKWAFYYCNKISSITIPNLSVVESYAFSCTGLTSVKIPPSVKSINEFAFSSCLQLATVEIPKSVTFIGQNAFDQTPWLLNNNDEFVIGGNVLIKYNGIATDVVIPSDITTIGVYAFNFKEQLQSVKIPNNITAISNGAFIGCSNLIGIVIPSSITKLEDNIFYNCSSISNISLPNTLTQIGDYAFYGCTALESLKVPLGVNLIGPNTFTYCDSLTLKTYQNSYAQNYAIANQIPFIEIVMPITMPSSPANQDGVTITKDNLQGLTSVNMQLDVKELSGSEAVVSVAFYDSSNVLLSIKTQHISLQSGTINIPISSVPSNTNKMIIYLWDSLNSMHSLITPFETI